MITTDKLQQQLHVTREQARHHARIASQHGTMPKAAAYAVEYAVKAELLQSLIQISLKDDKDREGNK